MSLSILKYLREEIGKIFASRAKDELPHNNAVPSMGDAERLPIVEGHMVFCDDFGCTVYTFPIYTKSLELTADIQLERANTRQRPKNDNGATVFLGGDALGPLAHPFPEEVTIPWYLKETLEDKQIDTKTKELIDRMVSIYGCYAHDWLGDLITKYNKLQFYCIKKDDFTPATDNGALLTEENCAKLNELRGFYPELYDEFQFLLQIANDLKCPIPPEINNLLNSAKERMNQALSHKSETYTRYIR